VVDEESADAVAPSGTPRPRSLAVATSRDHLVEEGRPFFYVADTIWSAFTHVPDADWPRYLEKRRAQGFNALQISILPILHDLSASSDLIEPFAGFWTGRPALGELEPAFLRRATERLAAATELGFVPVLVDIWCNYAPATWASVSRPECVFDWPAARAYLACAVESFASYSPIHVVSGDADFGDPVSTDFYAAALAEVKRLAPEALTAMHLQPEAMLPSVIADSPDLDLYVYQSGHHVELSHLSWALAESYRARPVQRPVINIEPCYEGHGHGHRYGRFDRRDVRRAWWQSLLAGASAGVAYGAHGVWGWHRRGASFNHADFSGVPFDRWDALGFPGADDVALTAHLARTLELPRSRPAQHLAPGLPAAARVAEAPGGVVCYLPWPTEAELALEAPATLRRWDLERRDVEEWHVSSGPVRLPLGRQLGDAVFVIEKEGPA
jgi:hypothetical protein